jgi:hypothetical protein
MCLAVAAAAIQRGYLHLHESEHAKARPGRRGMLHPSTHWSHWNLLEHEITMRVLKGESHSEGRKPEKMG